MLKRLRTQQYITEALIITVQTGALDQSYAILRYCLAQPNIPERHNDWDHSLSKLAKKPIDTLHLLNELPKDKQESHQHHTTTTITASSHLFKRKHPRFDEDPVLDDAFRFMFNS